MNWKKLFDEDRLNRGFDYYLEDRVYDVILNENSITSKVEGSRSKIYDVKINFEDDKINSLYCTCPYAYSDFNCKHMVATLYKMEEIKKNKFSSIVDKEDEETLFIQLLNEVDENKLRRFIYDKYYDNSNFKEDFINYFQEEFTPEDFDTYENMLENIFNIDVVELYNENGFYQETPFQKYLDSFLKDKINTLYKKKEYSYVVQLLYIIYENISEKVNVTQYINVDDVLKECNYYMQKVIDAQNDIDNEEIFNYLINKIRYDYNSKTAKYLIELCLNKFNSKNYLKQLDKTIDEIIQDNNDFSDEILTAKYELMKMLDYPFNEQKLFLENYKNHESIRRILINNEINDNNIDKAILYLNENKELYGKTYSLEDCVLLMSLYKSKNDKDNSIKELKSILYDYNVNDMFFIKQLKELCEEKEWNKEKIALINFYNENNAYDFLNELYVEEKDYDNLFLNIRNNCQISVIEDYKEFYQEKYNDEILEIYKNIVLKEAQSSKNISGYTLIIHYLELMIAYKDSSKIVKNLISVLKNKYNQRKLFMEKIEEFEIIYSLND